MSLSCIFSMFLPCGSSATPVSTLLGWSCLSLLMWTPVFCAGPLNLHVFLLSYSLLLARAVFFLRLPLQSSKKLLKTLETSQAVHSISLMFFQCATFRDLASRSLRPCVFCNRILGDS